MRMSRGIVGASVFLALGSLLFAQLAWNYVRRMKSRGKEY